MGSDRKAHETRPTSAAAMSGAHGVADIDYSTRAIRTAFAGMPAAEQAPAAEEAAEAVEEAAEETAEAVTEAATEEAPADE